MDGEGGFGGDREAGEVGHSGELVELDLGEPLEGGHERVEERAEQPWSCALEVGPEAGLRSASVVVDPGQGEDDRAVEQIGAGGEFADSVQKQRALSVEEDLLAVGIELTGGESSAGREAAERVAQPG